MLGVRRASAVAEPNRLVAPFIGVHQDFPGFLDLGQALGQEGLLDLDAFLDAAADFLDHTGLLFMRRAILTAGAGEFHDSLGQVG